MDLAADNRAQPCHDVAAKPTAADHDGKALPFEFDHAVNNGDGRHNHGFEQLCIEALAVSSYCSCL